MTDDSWVCPIPPQRTEASPTPAVPDWGCWFDPQTIGFDLKDLEPARLEWTPPCACDRQAAWAGAVGNRPRLRVRVEAAAYRDCPVYFEVMPAGREAARRGALSRGI